MPTGSDLFAALLEGQPAHTIVDFPRKGPDGKPIGQLALRVLRQEEQVLAASEAEKLAKKLTGASGADSFGSKGYADIYNNEAAVQVLFKACRDKDDLAKPLFPTPNAIRQNLTTDEITVLFEHYCTLQATDGPIVASLSEPEVESLIRRLAEGGDRFPLDLLSSDTLKTLAFSLACRVHDYQMSTSSPGSQPEGE